ncbi:MAG TPA: histone deacetylase [Planctomycetota bacterium]|nr:histone deacetylase [Planctomycetota bacterium]
MGRTALVHHPACLEHFAGPGHPERPERVAHLLAHLERTGLADELVHLTPERAPLAALERVHAAPMLRAVEAACASGRARLDEGDTYVCGESWEAALRAAGGVLAACDAVHARTFDAAFVAVRPPGHHAEHDRAMGFCLVNHMAVAAAHLRDVHGLERVAVIDWDVHHGNGTQHLFERDADVFYASLHQFPHYPGTGAQTERGLGEGEGATLNCPLDAGSGPREWLGAFEGSVLPALEAFAPQFVLVSAGYDAHRDDPLSGTRLDEATYAELTRGALELAARTAGGRLVLVLEGGYALDATARSAAASLEVLLGR